MRWQHLGLLIVATLSIGSVRASENGIDSRCAKLASSNHLAVQILSATRVPAGDFKTGVGQVIRVPGSCHLVAAARPTADSEIGFELWLPDRWTGRYVQLGNGGFAGNIDHPSLAAEIRRGNAAAMTDTGHRAGQFDASWALGHPEKVVDYGYRSIKVTADNARQLIADYYGRPPRRRYFIGCSNGGRQALVAAQRYPADWDGIIAGSPALRWTEQLAKFGAIQHRLRSSSANWISTSQLPAIQSAAIATCGERLDCRVDTRKLICRGDAACLTPAQAASLDAIQGDPLGFDPRFAAVPQNWDQWIVNPDRSAPSELAFATTAYRYLVHENALWEIERFDTRRDPLLASDKKIGSKRLAEILNADDPDLRGFARHGGKLIIYVGTADALISPRAGTEYFNAVWKRMGAIANDVGRLFVIPGMQHCQGGLAPNSFGQAWVAPALRPDPRFDVRLALEAWVERGRAPQALVAVRYSDGQRNEVVRKTIRAYRAGTADGDAR